MRICQAAPPICYPNLTNQLRHIACDVQLCAGDLGPAHKRRSPLIVASCTSNAPCVWFCMCVACTDSKDQSPVVARRRGFYAGRETASVLLLWVECVLQFFSNSIELVCSFDLMFGSGNTGRRLRKSIDRSSIDRVAAMQDLALQRQHSEPLPRRRLEVQRPPRGTRSVRRLPCLGQLQEGASSDR